MNNNIQYNSKTLFEGDTELLPILYYTVYTLTFSNIMFSIKMNSTYC
jgi:hypothetical protein